MSEPIRPLGRDEGAREALAEAAACLHALRLTRTRDEAWAMLCTNELGLIHDKIAAALSDPGAPQESPGSAGPPADPALAHVVPSATGRAVPQPSYPSQYAVGGSAGGREARLERALERIARGEDEVRGLHSAYARREASGMSEPRCAMREFVPTTCGTHQRFVWDCVAALQAEHARLTRAVERGRQEIDTLAPAVLDLEAEHARLQRDAERIIDERDVQIGKLMRERDALAERVRALEGALTPLLDFWDGVFLALRYEVDVADLTELGLRLGLVALVPHAQPCADEACACEGEAEELYEPTAVIATARAALAPASAPTPPDETATEHAIRTGLLTQAQIDAMVKDFQDGKPITGVVSRPPFR